MATDTIMGITYFACFTVPMINSILVQSCVFLAYATSPTVQILSVPCLSSHQRYVIVKGIVANEVIATTYFCLCGLLEQFFLLYLDEENYQITGAKRVDHVNYVGCVC